MTDHWKVSYRCPTPPWSQNEERRWVWQQTRRRAQEWIDLGIVIAKAGPWPRPLGRSRVTLTLIFNQHRRRDPMNYVSTVGKALIDGLVRGGLWPDDTPEWVVGPWLTIDVDPRFRWPQFELGVELMSTQEDK